jgi:hypothetical protein
LALAAIKQAIRHFRKLTKRDPDAFTDDLAGNLVNLASHHEGQGNDNAAPKTVSEALTVYESGTAELDPDHALALTVSAEISWKLREHDKARPDIDRAVGMYRDLAAANHDAFTPKLASALHLRFGILAGRGRVAACRRASR